MESLFLVSVISLLAIWVVYNENAYRQWLAAQDLLRRRLAVYQQLKIAVARVRATGAVSNVDVDRFAQAMEDMLLLFDADVDQLVSNIYEALLKKHALDALLEKANGQEKNFADQVLIDKALKKSRELASQISNGIYKDIPGYMAQSMRPRSLSSPPGSNLPVALRSSHLSTPWKA
jgi:hypothetical protein